jgi:hypothetical protein
VDGRINWPSTEPEANLVPKSTLLTESKFLVRWLNKDGVQITKEDYDIATSVGSPVFKAAFVGCTYSCG